MPCGSFPRLLLLHHIKSSAFNLFNMTPEKMLVVMAVLAAASPAYSKHAALWGRGDFSDKYVVSAPDVTNDYEMCETSECKDIADEFLSSMNKSVDPCVDFYEFACGSWTKKNVIPPDEAIWNRFMIFHRRIRLRAKEILEAKPDPSDSTFFKRAKQWYRSCMDTVNIERRGVKPIATALMQAGGWPIIMEDDEWDDEGYSWKQVELYYTRLTGAPTLYKVDAEAMPGLPTIMAPDIPLNDHLEIGIGGYAGEVYDVYIRIVERAVSLFIRENQSAVSKERVAKDVKEMVDFEKNIFELKQTSPDLRNMTFDQFIEQYDADVAKANTGPEAKIDFRSVMAVLLDMTGIRLNTSKAMFTWHLEYIKGLSELVKATSPRTIVNYIHWNFVAKMLKYTSARATKDLFTIKHELLGITDRPPRWLKCVEDVKMTHAYAAHLYSHKYLAESTINSLREMIKAIQHGLERQVNRSNWLDDKSKAWAKEKIENIKILVGFPEWYKNTTAVTSTYKGLTIGNDYFDNSLNYMRFTEKQDLQAWVGFSFENLDVWDALEDLEEGASYLAEFNTLLAPAASLQTPLLSPNIPSNINYGIAGFAIGHELGHGFDNNGITFGKKRNGAKLPKTVLKNYYQRTECFIDQYAKYFDGYFATNAPESGGTTATPVERLMSKKTEGENIADSTGLQTVFETYKDVNRKSSLGETRLPGLEEFTNDQLFFLSFGAMWCQVYRPNLDIQEFEEEDVHSPAKFRVIGAVSNTKGFAESFNCPLGSPMNPSNKCNIWEMPGAATKEAPRHFIRRWRN